MVELVACRVFLVRLGQGHHVSQQAGRDDKLRVRAVGVCVCVVCLCVCCVFVCIWLACENVCTRVEHVVLVVCF